LNNGERASEISTADRERLQFTEREGGGGEYGTGESDANANGVAIDYRQEKNRQKQ
jgi:hypothetical protein